MRILASSCIAMASCPHIADQEDGSGELIIVGRAESGEEVAVRISRDLLEQALTTPPAAAPQS